MKLPYSKPVPTGKELEYIQDALQRGKLAGDGEYTRRCSELLQDMLGAPRVLLTHSCTAALEMSAMLMDIGPGDEVIMPSFTFVSTANAVVLRGGVPVFVDIHDDTFNIDERLIEAAITDRTRGIMPVHYAGVGCNMDDINDIAKRRNLIVAEDAAQGLCASRDGKPLGTTGAMSAFSFHETKNIISGEGGALVINDPALIERAEIIREKGTNRSKFFRGQVDKYTWVDAGSSYLPSELIAAFLLAQLEAAEGITRQRLEIWNEYHEQLETLEESGHLIRPAIPRDAQHNGHIYHVRVESPVVQAKVIDALKEAGMSAVFHYVPLHSSPAGRRFGRAAGDMTVTDKVAGTIIRLPLHAAMTRSDARKCVDVLRVFFG